MVTAAVDPALILSGPGLAYWAPLGTAEPTHTPTAGLFPTTDWGGGWLPLGATDTGSQFSDSISTDNMEVAESYYPVRIVTTGREANWTMALAAFNAQSWKVALNGPTPTVTGTAGTTLTTIAPPALGSEVRIMIGWQSQDDTARFVGFQALQVGNIQPSFNKGTQKAVLAVEFRFEKPATGDPYHILLAGTVRA